jgi:protein phosphatase
MKGKNNEDRFSVSAHRLSESDNTPSLLAVVCDGVGGHSAGEVAAELAVHKLSSVVADSDAQNPVEILRLGVTEASQAVRAESEKRAAVKGMASTCVVVWVIADRLYTAYVGDSRIYLIRGDTIQQLTTDHTWVQEAIEYGALTPEQAKNHPNAHVIRRYLGSATPPEPDFRLRLTPNDTDEQAIANQGTRLQPGDYLLLCSDGLHDLVEKDEILTTVKNETREQALHSLTNLANERGGHDNITIILIDIPAQPTTTTIRLEPVKIAPKRRTMGWLLTCLIVAALVAGIVAVGGAIIYGVMHKRATPTPTLTSTRPAPSATLTPLPTSLPSVTPSLTPQPTATSTLPPLEPPPANPTDSATPPAPTVTDLPPGMIYPGPGVTLQVTTQPAP